jgi:hypothetical protein
LYERAHIIRYFLTTRYARGVEARAEAFLAINHGVVGLLYFLAGSGGATRVIPDSFFPVQLNHFVPGFLSYSVAAFLK